jgi:hypothetical protein
MFAVESAGCAFDIPQIARRQLIPDPLVARFPASRGCEFSLSRARRGRQPYELGLIAIRAASRCSEPIRFGENGAAGNG